MARRGSFTEQWEWPLQHEDRFVKVENTKDKFRARLDNPVFESKEVDVQTIKDEVVISCKHVDKSGFNRELNRAYTLPEDVDRSTLKWNVNEMGVLEITMDKIRK